MCMGLDGWVVSRLTGSESCLGYIKVYNPVTVKCKEKLWIALYKLSVDHFRNLFSIGKVPDNRESGAQINAGLVVKHLF